MSFDILGLEDAIATLEKTAREPGDFGKKAKRRLQSAVNKEARSHRYQNRTHRAEVNTQLLQFGSGTDVELTAQMNVEYASYLQDRGGVKWSRFDENVKAALDDIDDDASKLSKTV